MSFQQFCPLVVASNHVSEYRTVVQNTNDASETGLRWTRCWLLAHRNNRPLHEAIVADHEADNEPVILKFPTAERQRQKLSPQLVGKIKRQTFLGGLLSHYERVAA